MAKKIFNKEDFTRNNEREYQIEFRTREIGEGINLIIEKLNEKREYEVVQAPIRRFNDQIFVVWNHPFDGRILFNE